MKVDTESYDVRLDNLRAQRQAIYDRLIALDATTFFTVENNLIEQLKRLDDDIANMLADKETTQLFAGWLHNNSVQTEG